MAVFYIPILIFTGTKRIEWLFFVCTRALKVVYPTLLIVHAQNALGKMARPIQMIPAHPPINLHPQTHQPVLLFLPSPHIHTLTQT